MLHHIIPIGDSEPHIESLNCPCNPRLFEGDRWDECWHTSFDGREFILAIEVFLGIRCKDHCHFIDAKGNHCAPPPPYLEGAPDDLLPGSPA